MSVVSSLFLSELVGHAPSPHLLPFFFFFSFFCVSELQGGGSSMNVSHCLYLLHVPQKKKKLSIG